MKKKKFYEHPQTVHTSVEAETGFMTASIFDEENDQDKGVTAGGHEVGNEGDYTGLGWDNGNGGPETQSW